MLTAMIFIPLAGSILTLLIPKERVRLIRVFALLVSLVPLGIAVAMLTGFDFGESAIQFVERVRWIPSIGVSYFVGTDGISFPMLILTALISTLAILTSFSIEHRVKEFMALMLLLETGMLGVFASLDYFLFYVFFEVVLVPMYFLIGIWGGPRKEYAAIKFFLYTLLGSVVMLVGILAVYLKSGLGTFDILEIAARADFSPRFQWWVFLAFFFGFAVKVPIFPFHTWLPDAHVEAPTGGSMLLAGILLKMGAYGFYRIAYPTLPDAAKAFAIVMGVLGVINIVYGAFTAMAQRDLKKMVAYSSISHMGFVLLGLAALTPMSMNGGLYVMVSHGLISPLLFFLVGTVFYERTHTRMQDELGGLFIKMPVAASIMAFAALANLGLPGLSGFIGEFFTFVGAFPVFSTLTIIGVIGLVFTAAYHLRMIQRVLMGVGNPEQIRLPDISARELVVSVPIMVLVILLGVVPLVLLRIIDPAVMSLVTKLGGI